jgi:hypothetical protein
VLGECLFGLVCGFDHQPQPWHARVPYRQCLRGSTVGLYQLNTVRRCTHTSHMATSRPTCCCPAAGCVYISQAQGSSPFAAGHARAAVPVFRGRAQQHAAGAHGMAEGRGAHTGCLEGSRGGPSGLVTPGSNSSSRVLDSRSSRHE